MKAPRTDEQKRKRNEYDRAKRANDRRREIPQHKFGRVGPAVAMAGYKPHTVKDPEQELALIFARLGRDYLGPLPTDFVLHAVLDSPGGRS